MNSPSDAVVFSTEAYDHMRDELCEAAGFEAD